MILARVTTQEACTVEISDDGTVTIRPVTAAAGGTERRSSATVPAVDPEPRQAVTPPVLRVDQQDADARRRELARQRTARWRARKRGEGDASTSQRHQERHSVTESVTRDAVTASPSQGVCLSVCKGNIKTNSKTQTSNQTTPAGECDAVTCDGVTRYVGELARCHDVTPQLPPGQTVLPWYEPPAATTGPRATVAAHAVRADATEPPEPEDLVPLPRQGLWTEYPELATQQVRRAWEAWRRWRHRRAKSIRWGAFCDIWTELLEIYRDAGEAGVVRCLEWAREQERVSVFGCPREVYHPQQQETEAAPMYYQTYEPEPQPLPEQLMPEQRLAALDHDIDFFKKLGLTAALKAAEQDRAELLAQLQA